MRITLLKQPSPCNRDPCFVPYLRGINILIDIQQMELGVAHHSAID